MGCLSSLFHWLVLLNVATSVLDGLGMVAQWVQEKNAGGQNCFAKVYKGAYEMSGLKKVCGVEFDNENYFAHRDPF